VNHPLPRLQEKNGQPIGCPFSVCKATSPVCPDFDIQLDMIIAHIYWASILFLSYLCVARQAHGALNGDVEWALPS